MLNALEPLRYKLEVDLLILSTLLAILTLLDARSELLCLMGDSAAKAT